MIWLKITMAAVMSGSLFALVETVLPSRPSQPFTIQISDWAGDQVFAVIESLGVDPGPSVHFDIRRTPPARDAVEAFRAGLADAALIELSRLPELIPDEVRVVYAFDEVAGGGVLVAAPDIRDAAGLRGRPVGVTFGAAAQPVVFSLLDRAGLAPQDATLAPLASDAAEAALRTGRVGAVAALAPSQTTGLQRLPGTRLLASTQDLVGVATHVLVVREGRIPEQRDRMEAVLRAVDQAVRACRAAMDRCLDLMAAASGRPAAEWRQDLEAVRLLDLADTRTLLAGGNEAPLARRLAAALALGRSGAAPAVPAAMEWIDPSLAQEAARP